MNKNTIQMVRDTLANIKSKSKPVKQENKPKIIHQGKLDDKLRGELVTKMMRGQK